MDNTRYAEASPATATGRIAPIDNIALGFAIVCLAVLMSNALRITGLLPDEGILKTLAPLGAGAGAVALAIIPARIPPATRFAGYAVGITGGLLALGTVALTTIEIVTNYVFPTLDETARNAVLDGRIGAYLVIVSIGYVLIAIAFAVAVIATRSALPLGPALIGLGGALVGLRSFLPVWVVALGLVILGAGAVVLALAIRPLPPVTK